ncbi:MAG: hypothetical protein R3246_14095, partial [Acidimicrobiia bacterium]|nr:hypothetical protein [Acidimicrobiia bacterium]
MGRVARVLVLVMVVGMIPVAAGAAPGPRYFVDESTLPFGPVPGHEDSTRLWGVHNKAGYRIEVPADWNGDLVMWAHGFRGFDERLFFLPDEFDPGLRAYWLDQGFAWAASTYSKNDYNVAQGVKDTHALSRFFNGKVGTPDRVFIAGASMGGHITAVSIEQYRNAYVGAMPVCGVLGDYE